MSALSATGRKRCLVAITAAASLAACAEPTHTCVRSHMETSVQIMYMPQANGTITMMPYTATTQVCDEWLPIEKAAKP